MIQLPGVLAAAQQIQSLCEERGWRFCFIGGVAVQRWGQPRVTQDVDLTLLTGFGGQEAYVDALARSSAVWASRSDPAAPHATPQCPLATPPRPA